ncbi:MAG: cytochrome c oxidase subunit II [Acidobacteriaceae bacterium]|nr:cytochrome c oxidase subunit II [Acidobacteriaceae bacterium]
MFINAVIALLLQAQTSNLPEHPVANTFKPLASPGQQEKDIAILTLAITGAIFVVVGGLIVYGIWRYRRRPGDVSTQEPAQVYGSNQIEAAWTVIPILIVFVLIGVTARVIGSIENASPPPSTVKVRLIGHQWWWTVEYPQFGVTSANEIHVPVATNGSPATYLQLESVDVIHSFWIPQLAGKTDLIPNRTNYAWIDPKEPGIYLGNCAEYCGTQHANMLLRVIAEPPADFNRWADEQKRAANPDPALARAREIFESLACVNCHTIKGTGAVGKFGPDLTHLMSRQTIGSGVTTLTHEHLREWVDDPQTIKPGCLMPSMQLTNEQLDQVVAYLESLH